jgi:hypothetical protein
MIFADMGVNSTAWRYSLYPEIAEKLVRPGIPRNEIAAVGEPATDAQKQALFERVPNGTVRVLIGSIAKMGTGTNVQKRLIALHHVDAPDRDTIAVNARDGLTIDGRTYIASDAAVALSARLEQLPSWVDAATRIPLGNFRGLSFGMVLRPGFPPDAFLQGKSTLSTIFAKQRPGPRAVMNGLHALAGNCAIEANSVGQRIDIAEGQLRDYAARIRIRKRQQAVPLPPGETADDSDPASDTGLASIRMLISPRTLR